MAEFTASFSKTTVSKETILDDSIRRSWWNHNLTGHLNSAFECNHELNESLCALLNNWLRRIFQFGIQRRAREPRYLCQLLLDERHLFWYGNFAACRHEQRNCICQPKHHCEQQREFFHLV